MTDAIEPVTRRERWAEGDRTRADQEAAARYWASPIGQADRAKREGSTFFQVEIPHKDVSAWALPGTVWAGQRERPGAPDLLGKIEELGWHLEQASYVWVQTGEKSRDRFVASGQHVAVTGEVIGIYLFRTV